MEKKRSPIKYTLTILLLAALLFSGVYAWIIGDVVPKIGGTISIGNEAGLILTLSDETSSLIDLNKYYGISTGGMTLTEVSSADGQTFFKRDTSVYYEDKDNNEIITYCAASPLQKDTTGSYIDVDVTMTLKYSSTTSDYYVYFLNGKLGTESYDTGFSATNSTYITEEGLRAMRLALQVQGLGASQVNSSLFKATGTTNTYIAMFGNVTEDGTTAHPYATKAVIDTGKLILSPPGETETNAMEEDVCGVYPMDNDGAYTTDTGVTGQMLGHMTDGTHGTDAVGNNIVVHAFDDYAIGNDTSAIDLQGSSLPSSNYLFILNDTNRIVKMTIRIWLEGGSDYCADGKVIPNDTDTSDDAKDAAKLDLYFVAFTKS